MRALLIAATLLLPLPALAQTIDHSSHGAPTALVPPAAPEPEIEIQEASPPPTPAADMPGMDHGSMDHSTMNHGDMDMPATPAAPAPAATAHGGHGAHDATPLPIGADLPVAAPDRRGNTLLQGEVKDGVRVFQLTTSEIGWPVTDGVTVRAFAYNDQVPGPMLRVTAGEKIRVVLTNKLREPTTIHWHGVDVPFGMDGVPGLSQEPVPPGGSFTYEFTVPNTPGTFWYHSHVTPDKQQALGLYGAFIIDPKEPGKKAWDSEYTLMLGEWTVKDGGNVPSMPMEGMFPNYFTLNGKAWNDTEKLTAKVGERVLLRIIGSGSFIHPIHLHGAPFKVIATDGHPVPAAAQLTKDTILVGPGERYDILWTPTRPGTWLVHCHINHHTMNDGVEVDGMGGMALPIEVTE